MTLEDYRRQIKVRDCQFCRRMSVDANGLRIPEKMVLIDYLPIEHYPHSDGWTVEGLKGRQWLFVTCPSCKYGFSLSKLGVPREEIEK